MRLSSYIVRRGGRLYFRMRVPADVRALIRRKELKRSLETGDARVARRRAARLAALAFNLVASVRSDPMLTEDQIARLARQFYDSQLDGDSALRMGASRHPELAQQAATDYDNRDAVGARLRRDLAVGHIHDLADDEAKLSVALCFGTEDYDDLTETQKEDADETLMRLQTACMRALVEVNARAKERDQGDWAGQPSDPFLQPRGEAAASPEAPDRPASTIPAADDAAKTARSLETPTQYVEHVLREKEATAGLATKYRATMRALEDIIGAKAMHLYTEQDIVAFKDALLALPTRALQKTGFTTLREAIAWNQAQPARLRRPTLAAGTINEGYLPYIRETFKHAADNGHAPTAVGQRVHVARTPGQRRGDDKLKARHRFSPAKLQKIFTQPLFLGARSPKRLFDPGDYLDWSWRFWVPLAMTFMGMRPQELGQLEVTDVILRCGYPCLQVTTISDSDDYLDREFIETENGEKTVKSKSGYRELPLHPVLIDLGFLVRVEARKKALHSAPKTKRDPRIFPDWPAVGGRYAPAATKFFNRDEVEQKTDRKVQGFLARAGVKTKTTVLYSLRHNYKRALRQCGFSEGEQDLLMGHAGTHVSHIYGDREAYFGLIEKVRKLEHEGLDLGPLFQARGRRGQAAAGPAPDPGAPLKTAPNVVPFNRTRERAPTEETFANGR